MVKHIVLFKVKEGENVAEVVKIAEAALLPLVGSEHLRLDGNSALLDAGCAIDLGGIAKGYASDVVAQVYRDHGISGGWASLGGNVYAHGTKPDGSFSLNADMLQMVGSFTILRASGMVGMVGVTLAEKDLLDLNRKLNKIKAPKNQ